MTDAFDDLFARIDGLRAALAQRPDDLQSAYRLALAYARVGAVREAEHVAAAHGLSERFAARRGELAIQLWEDIGCIGPRLTKDRALAVDDPAARRQGLRRAAEAYEAVARRTAGYYPMINAATLRLLAGDAAGAARAARDTLALLGPARRSYWEIATASEAELVLGDAAAARATLGRAFAIDPKPGFGDVAATIAQLRRIAESHGLDAGWLDAMAPPPVVHFAGHIIGPPDGGGRVPAEDEAEIARRLDAALAGAARPGPWRGLPFAAAYGALAAGTDILVAEWLLDRGVPLHVVLPVEPDLFLEASVKPSGTAWVGRFRRCLAAAADVRVSAEGDALADDALLTYGSRHAMGLAALHARRLATQAIQVLLYDGRPASGGAGTAVDHAAWAGAGRPQVVVRPPPRPAPAAGGPARRPPARVIRAILFADVKGFSKLPDAAVPAFTEQVFGAFERVLAPHRASGEVVETNTWGDAVLVVVRDVVTAAGIATGMLEALRDCALGPAEGCGPLEMRVGAHLGPVFEAFDPIRGSRCVVGAHMSIGARIEPVAPVGAAWVTEHFAAALELAAPDAFACEVVGRSSLAKNYGEMRVFRLARRREA